MNHQKGLEAARQLAAWRIGDPKWADMLINAYYNPDKTIKELRAERDA